MLQRNSSTTGTVKRPFYPGGFAYRAKGGGQFGFGSGEPVSSAGSLWGPVKVGAVLWGPVKVGALLAIGVSLSRRR
jgi:hypothetical protein